MRIATRYFTLLACCTLSACGTLRQRTATARSPVHVAFAADVHDARIRSATGVVVEPEVSTGLVSLDLVLQRLEGSGLGLAGRIIGGGTQGPSSVTAALLLGSKQLAGELGVGSRTGFDPDEAGSTFEALYPMAHIGVRSRANFGTSPFSAHLRAARYIGLPGETDEEFGPTNLTGWSAETGVNWTWERFPVTATLGYRIERFRVYNHEQEVSSLALGAGFLFGRR